MLSGGFDPERLAPPGRTEPVISKIVGHDLESGQEPSSLRPDDSSLSRTFRDLVARFDELSSENAELRDLNTELQARIEDVQDKLTRLERSLTALSDASQSALIASAQVLEKAERLIEFRRGGIQAEIDTRFEDAKRQATETPGAVQALLEEARELSSLRALDVDIETLSILREAKQELLIAAGKLHEPT